MRKIIGVSLLFSAALCCALTACSPTLPSEPAQDVPLYSSSSSLPEDVPHYSQMESGDFNSSNIPDDILTVDRAKERFKELGFEEYKMVSDESSASPLYRSSSDTTGLEIEDDGNGIVSSMRFDVGAEDQVKSIDAINKFISLAIAKPLDENEKNAIKLKFEALSQKGQSEISNEEHIEIESQTFIFLVDSANNRYVVNW